jgi:hypothetical protein
LPGLDRVADVHQQPDAGSRLHRVLLAGPAGPEPPGGHTDGEGVQPGEHAGAVRDELLHMGRDGERGGRVAALCRDHPLPHLVSLT